MSLGFEMKLTPVGYPASALARAICLRRTQSSDYSRNGLRMKGWRPMANSRSNAASPPRLLVSASEAAKMLAISERTLWARTAPRGPIPIVKVTPRTLRYSLAALETFIAANQQP